MFMKRFVLSVAVIVSICLSGCGGSSSHTLATPTFSVTSGTVVLYSGQPLTITAPSGASVYYTETAGATGTTPTTSSTLYSGAITISGTTGSEVTIEAIAVESGKTDSAVATATYTFGTQLAAPTIAPTSGAVPSGQLVTITNNAGSGASIYYTTNSTTPSATNGTLYNASFAVTSAETIEAVAVESGYVSSSAASAIYTLEAAAATPQFSVASGAVPSGQSVTITDSTSGATIYYCVVSSGSCTPTTSSTKYTGALTITSAETIEAIAVASGYSNSATASAAYTMEGQTATPQFSVAAGAVPSGQSLTITDSTTGAKIYYCTTTGSSCTPTTAYTGALTITSAETVEAYATATGYTTSSTNSATYTIEGQAATPQFSVAAGAVNSGTSLTITDATTGAAIYYCTTTGSSCTPSTQYTGALTISSAETVEAYATASGYSQSATNSATYTIVPALTFTTTKLPQATYNTAYSQTIAISGGVAPYSYTVSSGSLPGWVTTKSQDTTTGTITLAGTAACSSATTTYEPCQTIFTIKVTDAASNSASQQFTLTVYSIGGTNDSQLKGQYAFYAKGWQDGEDIGSSYKQGGAGSFVADGAGNITSGELDYNNAGSNQPATVTFNGTYALDSNNLGQIVLTMSNGGNIIFAFSAGGLNSGVATRGALIEYDDTDGIGSSAGDSRVAGELALQTPADFTQAQLTGGYAFGMEGETCPTYWPSSSNMTVTTACTAASDKGPLSAVGYWTLNGSGSISGGEEDVTIGTGSSYTEVAQSGSYLAPDSFGRVKFTVTTGTLGTDDNAIWPTDFVGYMVDSTKLFVLSTDWHQNYALLAGKLLQRTTSSFSNGTLSTSESAVFWDVQPDGNYASNWGTSSATGTTTAEIGLVAIPSTGSITLTLQQAKSDTSAYITQGPTTGTYSVDSNGRMTLSGFGSNGIPVFYLVGTNQGFGTLEGSKHSGLQTLESQTATTLNSGTYVNHSIDASPITGEALGTISASTSTSYSYEGANSDQGGTLTWGESSPQTGTLSYSSSLVSNSNGSECYIITATKMACVDSPSSTGAAPGAAIIQQ
jgi:hypothetical protein